MRWIDEFRTFIQRGNVIDLAVAVIIGAAFNGVVQSLVGDVFTPVLGFTRSGGEVLSIIDIPLYGDAKIKLGAFLQSIFNFVVTAFCVFLIVKGMNTLHVHKLFGGTPAPAELTTQEKLLTEIRDLLKQQGTLGTTLPDEKPIPAATELRP